MTVLSDETLMAFADGELDAVTRARVAAQAEKDSSLRARLAAFEATGRSLSTRYRRAMEEPVPERLLAAVLGTAPAPICRPVPGLLGNIRDAVSSLFTPAPRFAAVAAAALAIGVIAGWGLRRAVTGPELAGLIALEAQSVVAAGDLKRVLETAASGTRVTASGAGAAGEVIRARMTFKSRDDGFCRQYEIASGNGQGYAGIGCRDTAGRWQIRMHAPALIAPQADQRTIAAGADAAVVAAVEQLLDGDALGAADEADLIAKGWKR